MSVNGIMRTSASGMNAQANRLSAVSDNIANSSTNGYKRAVVEFSSLVLPRGGGEYNSGSVQTQVRNLISQQGGLGFTSSATDLAVSGNGFFVVTDNARQEFYTRAGSFVSQTDSDTGKTYLVNAAGYRLTGTPLPSAGASETIELPLGRITVAATTDSKLAFNFPVSATKLNEPPTTGELAPSSNDAASVVQQKSTLVTYDNVGKEVVLDVYTTKTGDNAWEVSVYDSAQAAAGGGFPYASVNGEPLMQSTTTITFDPTTGKPTTAPAALSVNIPNGATVSFDLSAVTEYDTDFTADLSANGSRASVAESFSVSEEGVVSAVNSDGSLTPIYQLKLARFPSPDNLKPLAGNVYAGAPDAGEADFGIPGELGFGTVISGALEKSTVDLASELTDMIESQRSYSANSKVFQTGSEILDVLVNLKR